MSFEKNVVEYNLSAIKLSSEKILGQFFVWLPITEKIADNRENLTRHIFDVRKWFPNWLYKLTLPNQDTQFSLVQPHSTQSGI